MMMVWLLQYIAARLRDRSKRKRSAASHFSFEYGIDTFAELFERLVGSHGLNSPAPIGMNTGHDAIMARVQTDQPLPAGLDI